VNQDQDQSRDYPPVTAESIARAKVAANRERAAINADLAERWYIQQDGRPVTRH
jgi:hypothetical protein